MVFWIVLIELTLLVILGYEAISHEKFQMPLTLDISAWESRYVTYDENGWKASAEDMTEFSDGESLVDLIYGPFLTLPKSII